ncbi:MAG: hypothetical protein ACXVV5_26455 [Solirubrobacteraceae bacterium]
MRTFRLVGALLVALIALGLIAAGVLARSGKSAGPPRILVHFPVNGPGGVNSHTCFWGLSYTQHTRNIIWPDSHTDYPASSDTIPAGGKIVLHGRFPHARFFSLTTSSVLGVIRSYLYDDTIKPDPGSSNPFLPGATRNTTHRNYTVTVIDQPDPGAGHRKQNVLYGGVAGQAPGTGPMGIIERVYLPDRRRDFSGGVGDPVASYVAADGTAKTGQAACDALQTKSGASAIIDVNKALWPPSLISGLLKLSSSPTQPAVNPPRWYKYFTPQRLIQAYYERTPLASLIPGLPTTGTGLGANPANGYVGTWLDRTFGPNRSGDNIAVLRGKLPTTPATYAGERKMASGTQLRYWSMCNAEGLTSGKTTGPCLADEEVPINSGRIYTIVLSLPRDRPTNATLKCGIGWMNWGTTGDGYTRPRTTLMIMRNLATKSTASTFPQAVQNVRAPGDEKRVMGAYLPRVSYTDRAGFEARGCGGLGSR